MAVFIRRILSSLQRDFKLLGETSLRYSPAAQEHRNGDDSMTTLVTCVEWIAILTGIVLIFICWTASKSSSVSSPNSSHPKRNPSSSRVGKRITGRSASVAERPVRQISYR